MIILDFGSGETCENSSEVAIKMIDELDKVVTNKDNIVIKWQLFSDIPPLKALKQKVFYDAYHHAKSKEYQTTASVFDEDSLSYLVNNFDVPFVKLAATHNAHDLISKIPEDMNVVMSLNKLNCEQPRDRNIKLMYTVSEYPAKIEDYVDVLDEILGTINISDHTSSFKLYWRYRPEIYETHFKLENSIGLDNGIWAKTPEQLKEIL